MNKNNIVKDQQITISINMLKKVGFIERDGDVWKWTSAGVAYMKELPENPDVMSPLDYAKKLASF